MTEKAGSGLYFIVFRRSRFALEMWGNTAFLRTADGEPNLQSGAGGQDEWFLVRGS